MINGYFDYDVLIIGAGLSGIFSLYRMRELGLRAKAFEAGSGEGGTWFWSVLPVLAQSKEWKTKLCARNRYPGARFDSESYSYTFSFSQELLDEWSWTEHFAPQTETLKYCQFVTDKLNLHNDIQFNTRITSAHFHETTRSWLLEDENGNRYTSRFLITAIGILNQPTLPNIPGVNDFKGAAFHTARWPHGPVALEGKRVAVIGTGATGIQVIQKIVETVGHLTVFQRTPNWAVPLRNAKISPEEMQEIRNQYPEIFQKCLDSSACFIHGADSRGTFEVTPEERVAHWEKIYSLPGFAKYLGNFRDIGTNREANDLYSEFIANKIRQRIKDPAIAEKLIPKNHGFGTRRVPLESGYYEAFNQPNVSLVDVTENPIECVTEKGIKTRDQDFEFDIIVYATGFDAVTGAFYAMDFQGLNGIKLKDHWGQEPRTFLGLTVEGFPNMFMIMGPHQMFGNIPRSIEYAVGWVTDLMRFCRDNNITYAEATNEGVRQWTQHVHDCSEGLLSNEVDSWMTGVNKNLADKQKRSISRYGGPAPGYRKRCDEVAARQYSEMKLA